MALSKRNSAEYEKAWLALIDHFSAVKDLQISDLFREESDRFRQFSIELDGLLFDYSKHRVTHETMSLLRDLANACKLSNRISELFEGKEVNHTEHRAALHTALRNPDQPKIVNGTDVAQKVRSVLARMETLSTEIRTGEWEGYTREKITDVVNIGIGGSDLGPRAVVAALKPFHSDNVSVHFVSNIDGSDISQVLNSLRPESTLFLVASKSFATQETLLNASTAKKWFFENGRGEPQLERHFVAITARPDRAAAFGVSSKNVFEFWDWVGGRYSLWSAIGLPIAIAIGFDRFRELLEGANAMDQHFRSAPFERNVPVISGLIGIWYNNFFKAESIAIIPYDQYLHLLPAYVQQLDMESNGKHVTLDGQRTRVSTGPIVWGYHGTNAQHAFFQLLHQGTKMVPCEFIATMQPHRGLEAHHDILISNCIGQSEALMCGRSIADIEAADNQNTTSHMDVNSNIPHRLFDGNKPSSTFFLDNLDPRTLGALLAAYEHKIFVQGAIWNINSFDQWGVELGKDLAMSIQADLDSPTPTINHDASTNGLINYYKNRRR